MVDWHCFDNAVSLLVIFLDKQQLFLSLKIGQTLGGQIIRKKSDSLQSRIGI